MQMAVFYSSFVIRHSQFGIAMAETTGKSLRVVVVTPERAVLDEPAELVTLPMYDGEHGVMAGHSAFVGQLGPGELRITTGTETKRYYIDGGFAQVAENVVNVLTAKAIASELLKPEVAAKARTEADALPQTTTLERETRTKAIARARGMGMVARKVG